VAQLVEALNCKLGGRGVIEIFHLLKTSGPAVALGPTQPVTEMSTGGKGTRCVGQTTLRPLCTDCLEILGVLSSLSLKGVSSPVKGWLYLYSVLYVFTHVAFPCSETEQTDLGYL
jgi:hypothetical protein